ncbi:hypothetical protein FOL47_011073 [Perkinsus chesapeaki]|uniref:Uncharacterized protein n=1 Tax=Perkinsus chesapeaki TaxID=330153 RepID=A0A7J6KYP9_PERCH|nr:hypothetical protein FOL47_011073 [Perkinsus chesapeaki]
MAPMGGPLRALRLLSGLCQSLGLPLWSRTPATYALVGDSSSECACPVSAPFPPMSASSSSSATTSPLSVFFDETPDDAAAVQNLQQALSSISVTSAAALSELGKDSSGTLCQQLAEAAAHPELHLLKGNKQASALVIIKYQRILRSAITRATSTVSVTGGVDAARLATPSPTGAASPRQLHRLRRGCFVASKMMSTHMSTSTSLLIILLRPAIKTDAPALSPN